MNDPSCAEGATEFTNDWAQFEGRLASLLGELAQPTLNDIVRLRYPMRGEVFGEMILESALGDETSDIGSEPCGVAYLIGVRVLLCGRPPRFYPILDGGEIPEAAHDVCTFLRDDALVPHPSLLTAEAEGFGRRMLDRLGLQGVGGVVREAAGPNQGQSKRRISQRGVRELGGSPLISRAPEAAWPEISWPQSIDETCEAVEELLTLKYSKATRDIDDDYVIDTSAEGGTHFYLTVINDRPKIVFRKAVVILVNSRQSAVIEANYLNRETGDIRWVLRGYTLYQEHCFLTAPFVPVRFAEMLDLFGEQYGYTVSELRMRLGGDS